MICGEIVNPEFLVNIKPNRRKIVSIILLNLGTLSWFFVFNNYLEDIFRILTPNSPPEWGSYIGNSIFYGSIIVWSIIISYIGKRINRRKLLFTSIFLGLFSTILLGLFEGTFSASILSFLLGTSFGLGLPSSMALIADCTAFDNRGKISGITLLSTFITAFIAMVINQLLNPDIGVLGFTNLLGFLLILAVLRSISIFALIIEKCDRLPAIVKKKSRLQIYAYKDFFVYLCTFLLFSIASGLAWNLIPEDFNAQVAFGSTVRFIIIAIFGVVAGILADKLGRKQPIIIGLAALGIGFLMLGFDMNDITVIAYMILSGITWGSFFVVFLAVPGDLSFPNSREKFYALGYILPLFGQFIIAAIPAETLRSILPEEHIAIVLGVCLFLAIYPLSRAKETLTESKMQERKMREHIERIRKIVEEEEEPYG